MEFSFTLPLFYSFLSLKDRVVLAFANLMNMSLKVINLLALVDLMFMDEFFSVPRILLRSG